MMVNSGDTYWLVDAIGHEGRCWDVVGGGGEKVRWAARKWSECSACVRSNEDGHVAMFDDLTALEPMTHGAKKYQKVLPWSWLPGWGTVYLFMYNILCLVVCQAY